MYILINEKNEIIAISNAEIDTDDSSVKRLVVNDVNSDVVKYPERYCYSEEKGIYENPNYKPPEKPIDETENAILDLAEMAIDHEMRLSMLELGLTE